MGGTLKAVLGAISLLTVVPGWAQQGHPLVGSWSGEWQPTGGPRQRILLVLDYEDDELSGAVFFGTRRIELTSATLDPGSWSVRLEARDEAADHAVDYLIMGAIENLGSITARSIAGSLSGDGESGDFRVVMN